MKKIFTLLFFATIISISYSQVYYMDAVSGQTINTCKGIFLSSGGDTYGGDLLSCFGYYDDEDYTVTFCSGTPGVPIRVSFLDWWIESGYDFLRVYDGPSTASPLLASITGYNDIYNAGARAYTSTGTCLTFRFTSDGSTWDCGWTALIGCQPQVCGTNQPASDACTTAPQICDFNGYCGNTGGWYTRDNGQIESDGTGPGSELFCGSIENNSWLSFIATSTTAVLNIASSGCAFTGSGIQAQVFSTTNCSTFTSKSNCVNQSASAGTAVLNATGLTIGQKYYVMIDGYGGNICNYTVTAQSGVQTLTIASSAGATICNGGTTTLTLNGASAGSTYAWTPVASITGATNGQSITASPTGNTTYSCLVTSATGCNNETVTYTLNVTPATPVSVSIAPSTNNVCAGTNVTFTATPSTTGLSPSYQWYLNGSPVGTNSPTYSNASLTNNDSIRVVMSSAAACISGVPANSNSVIMVIKPNPTVNVTNPNICYGKTAQPIASGATTYTWTGGLPAVFNPVTPVLTAGTTYTVTGTTAGCTGTAVSTITIKPTPTTNITQAICNGSSYAFNGNNITSAGVYRDTLSTSLGCDSFLVLTVTIKPTPTTNISQAICNGSSFVFNGNMITVPGVYRDTLTTSLGCDSFIVLTVTNNLSPTTNITQGICNGTSYAFNGNNITSAGVYRDTLTTSLGCDSFIVLTTTLKPTPTTNISQSICNGSSIVFNGNTITAAGTFRDTLTTSLGCDSFIVLTTTIKPTPTTNITQAICNGSSIVFNGNTITSAGVYRDTLTTSLGCDSFIVLTVTIKPTPTSNIAQGICNGNSIVFNGNTITSAGVYRDTLTTSLGCDSFIVLTVSIKPEPTTNITQSICNGSSYAFNGNNITSAGVYRDTLTTSLGCDSFIVLTVTIKPTPTTNISQSICQGSSYAFNGNAITTAGTFRDTLSTSLGCDSFIILTVSIKPEPTTNITQSICNGSSVLFNGNTITTAGVYRDTLTTSLGCDSFIVLTVSIKPTPTTNISQSICNGNSIVFNGNTISIAGTFRDTLTTSLGCDSFIVLTVTIKPTPTTNITQSICQGSSIIFNGNTITTGGTFRDTLSTTLGCDSFIVLTTTIKPTPTTNITQAICQGSSIVFNGNTISTAGTFRDTLTTSLGCDSFIVLTTTIKPTPTTNLTQSICQGSSIVFNGNTISTAGTFRDTLSTSLGCDSFIVLTVSIKPEPTTNITQSLCNGSSYAFNGNTITSSGVYRDTLTTSLGCDSFIVLTVTIKPTPTTNISQSICNGSSIVFNGNTITSAGTFRDTLTTSLGCDSFIVLTVTIKPTPTTNITQSICQGSSIVFNGNTISTAGTFRDTLSTSLGCDSFIVLTVTIKPTKTTNISQAICSGSSISFNGNTISSAGVYRDTLATSLGCDSFIVLTVSVNSVIRTTLNPSICTGASVTVGTHTYSATGTYFDTLPSFQGCDSIITTNLTVNPKPTTNITQAICNGSSIVFNGNTISTAGTFRDTLTTSLGCDSFVVLTTTIKPTPTTNISRAICLGSSFIFNGNSITSGGTYRDTLSTTLGCDSFIVLTVTIKPTPTTNITQSLCQGNSIVFNGNTVSTAGTFRDTLSTSLGCDSFVVLTVTVKPTPTTNISRSICQGSSFVFNGNNITSGGTYRDTLTTTLGCDSFIVLSVTVKPTPTTNIAQSICQGSSIAFNGLNITASGVYRDTLATSLGCDSFIVFTVKVNARPTTNISRSICQGASTTFNGQTITAAGTFRDTLSTSLGCDSFVVLTVSVNPIKTTNISNAICSGSSYTFNGQSLTSAGVYRDTLTQSNGCDSFIVLTLSLNPTFTPAVTILSNKTDVCNGDQVVFTATATNTGVPNPSYQWYLNGNPVGTNSAQYSSATLNDNDKVEVKVTSTATCVTSATAMSNSIIIKVSSINYSIVPVAYCTGEESVIDLNIPQTAYSVSWKNGTDTFTTVNLDSTIVKNTVNGSMQFTIKYGNGCTKTGNVPITVYQLPAIDAIVDQPNATYEEEVQLNVNGSNSNSYNWTPAAQVSNDSVKNPTAIIKATTLFVVQAKDINGCINTDSVQVNLINECVEEFIYVPSAFSPNNDNINDCFHILSPPKLSNFKMVIFDRWGEKVFEASNTDDCWNGIYKGSEAQSDSYIYVISYTCYNGTPLSKKGTITLLR